MARCRPRNWVIFLIVSQTIVFFVFIGLRWQHSEPALVENFSTGFQEDHSDILKCAKLLHSDDTRGSNGTFVKLPLASDEKRKLMQVRVNHALEKCANLSKYVKFANTHIQGTAWTYSKTHLAYCVTPKVGCTYWKRVFRFINGDFNDHPKTPNDITRMYTHYGKLKNTEIYQLSNKWYRTKLSYYKTFMFARNPYTRLWSAYIDKYFLPDFWRSDAKNIVQSSRKTRTAFARRCASDITFEQFLQYVVKRAKSGGAMNEHYVPIHRLCSPCNMKFDYIGKQESFSADTKFILEDVGLGYLQNDNSNFSSHVIEELNTLIKYNFGLKQSLPKGCFQEVDIARRLWLTFQINGYISTEAKFPEEDVKRVRYLNETEKRFSDLVMNQYKSVKRSSAEWKKQRKQFFISAYRHVPLSIMKDVQIAYHEDFELFDYDEEPVELFNRSSSDEN